MLGKAPDLVRLVKGWGREADVWRGWNWPREGGGGGAVWPCGVRQLHASMARDRGVKGGVKAAGGGAGRGGCGRSICLNARPRDAE